MRIVQCEPNQQPAAIVTSNPAAYSEGDSVMETFKPVTIGVVSPDGKFTPVKRDDRQPLPQEVAEAIAALDAMTYAGSRTHAHWSYVKAHLHRLAEENARLKARFAEAPVVTVRDVYAIAAFPFTRIDAATMDRRVHLVVEDGE